ncbi:MAG: TusE/DsrC/DsvC family sulfur relay protein, partial [Thermodesulfobacteriota bacterium]
MATVEFQGKTFEVDEDGFLQSFDMWAPEWVDYVKEQEGIKEITEEHQKVIDFL